MGPADAEGRRKTVAWRATPETPAFEPSPSQSKAGVRWMPEAGELPSFPSAPTMAPADSPMPDKGRHVGEPIGGRYKLIRALGHGELTQTWEAVHIELGRHVAIKFLRQQAAGMAEEMLEVARMVALIRHPHVAQYSDFGRLPSGDPYFVMELLSGSTVSRVLQRRNVIPWARAINIAVQICKGIGAAHEVGVVHRDIRPGNIFLVDRTNETSDFVKVVDFGIARGTRIGGTPGFMSPEQCRHEPLDARSDVYAMGCLLYAMATGDPPFGRKGDNLHWRQINEAPKPLRDFGARQFIPDELEAVVARCLAKDPARRFSSSAELGDALSGLANFAAATSVVHGKILETGSFSAPMGYAGRKAPDLAYTNQSKEPPEIRKVDAQPAPSGSFSAEAVAAIVLGSVLFVTGVGVGVWWLVSSMIDQPAPTQVAEPVEGDAVAGEAPAAAAASSVEAAEPAAAAVPDASAPPSEAAPSESGSAPAPSADLPSSPEAAPAKQASPAAEPKSAVEGEPKPADQGEPKPADQGEPKPADQGEPKPAAEPKPADQGEPKPSTEPDSMAKDNIGHEDLVDPWN